MGKQGSKRNRQKQKYQRMKILENLSQSNSRSSESITDPSCQTDDDDGEVSQATTRLTTPNTTMTRKPHDSFNTVTYPIPLPNLDQAPKTPSPSRRNLHVRCLSKADSILNVDLDNTNHDNFFFTHQRVVPGDDGMLFKQAVTIRPKNERKPMNWAKRIKAKQQTMTESPGANDSPLRKITSIRKKTSSKICWNGSSGSNSTPPGRQQKQFIFSTKKSRNTLWEKVLNRINPDEFTYQPNSWIHGYITWAFKSNFFIVFMSFLSVFLLVILIFGVLLMWAGMGKGQCFIVGGGDFTDTNAGLADGFALSWTTFTTVGYGAVYPATGTEYERQMECVWITLITTIESFVGLLYAGMCAAILFGKVGRIQSHAQVRFSDALCLEYGVRKQKNGSKNRLEPPQEFDYDDEIEVEQDGSIFMSRRIDSYKFECPVLKFQLVNELSNVPCGEILDATLSCVVKEDNESSMMSNEAYACFSHVLLREASHPFFNRVWQGRHILDEKSPILSPHAKSVVKRNGGCWPSRWNNPEDIRKHITFSSLIVTLTGISNISANTVQIAKRFHKYDMLIGYDFAPMLYQKEGSEKLKVDMNLINDVVEQYWAPSELLPEYDDDDNFRHPRLVSAATNVEKRNSHAFSKTLY